MIYSESHEEVAKGKNRVPTEVSPSSDENYYAQKLSALAAGLVMI